MHREGLHLAPSVQNYHCPCAQQSRSKKSWQISSVCNLCKLNEGTSCLYRCTQYQDTCAYLSAKLRQISAGFQMDELMHREGLHLATSFQNDHGPCAEQFKSKISWQISSVCNLCKLNEGTSCLYRCTQYQDTCAYLSAKLRQISAGFQMDELMHREGLHLATSFQNDHGPCAEQFKSKISWQISSVCNLCKLNEASHIKTTVCEKHSWLSENTDA